MKIPYMRIQIMEKCVHDSIVIVKMQIKHIRAFQPNFPMKHTTECEAMKLK